MSDHFRISDPSDIGQMITTASSAGFNHVIPLLEAARLGIIRLVILDRASPFPKRQLQRVKPSLVLIGDDDHQPTGPSGWACAEGARDWAKHAMIHGCGGTPAMYRKAVADCLACGRHVLVETSSKHLEAWTELFSTVPIKLDLIVPRDGQHPQPIAKGDLQ